MYTLLSFLWNLKSDFIDGKDIIFGSIALTVVIVVHHLWL